eukprot:TRINITY_DN18143_c0_g1_i1.p1 TRINITY_DN18143_c0_g1~~TRINITY_DN18143_c0_g1_i1.p1  ORF type:complete len:159 (+),score=19.04 TRINITY_DN18143_c0_g1_i1:992-1468(+)
MRSTFPVRSRMDKSIFPLIGVAYVIAKLACLAAVTSDIHERILLVTVVELFSTPSTAVAFMEKAFCVGTGSLCIGGRLVVNRHVSSRPVAARAVELGKFFNPTRSLVQWLSRVLCLREELSVAPGDTYGSGGMTRVELDALAVRFRSPALVSQASTVG